MRCGRKLEGRLQLRSRCFASKSHEPIRSKMLKHSAHSSPRPLVYRAVNHCQLLIKMQQLLAADWLMSNCIVNTGLRGETVQKESTQLPLAQHHSHNNGTDDLFLDSGAREPARKSCTTAKSPFAVGATD